MNVAQNKKKLLNIFNSVEVGKLWEANAEAWIQLSEEGYDVYRDYVNLPHFLSILPDIENLRGLDIGCGTGHNTTYLADMHARMTGIDISPTLISYATKTENKKYEESHRVSKIIYKTVDATNLPFSSESFDFATSFHCIMDIPEYETVFAEAYRILKQGGFLQFSIPHPCFWTHELDWIYSLEAEKKALACKDYFNSSEGSISEWGLDNLEQSKRYDLHPLRTPIFRRTLSQWIKSLLSAGFIIDNLEEPQPSEEALEWFPALDGCKIVAFSLIICCHKA